MHGHEGAALLTVVDDADRERGLWTERTRPAGRIERREKENEEKKKRKEEEERKKMRAAALS